MKVKSAVNSRKQQRKEFRKSKKINRHAYFSKKLRTEDLPKITKPTKESVVKKDSSIKVTKEEVEPKRQKRQFNSLQEQQQYENKKEKLQHGRLQKEMEKKKVEQLKKDNLNEDKEIKRLEKYLKLNKKKSKSVPKVFASDGLDYLLEVCDRDQMTSAEDEARIHGDSDSDFEDDLADITGQGTKSEEIKNLKPKLKKNVKASKSHVDSKTGRAVVSSDDEQEIKERKNTKKKRKLSLNESEEDMKGIHSNSKIPMKEKEIKEKKIKKTVHFKSDDSSIDDNFNDEDSEEDIEEESDEVEEVEVEMEKEEGGAERGKKTWEDIYGRTRDSQGNVVTAYRPPHLQTKTDKSGSNAEKVIRLKRQLKGLLNRLAENNMASISSQVEELYMKNSRNDMNETLCELISEAVISEVLTPERLVAENAMLVTVLSSNVGMEIGAYFLQHLVARLVSLLRHCAVEDKRLNNLMFFIASLYNFKVFHAALMYEIIHRVLSGSDPGEKEVELILIVLRTVGFTLRKDDPVALKTLVLRVHEVANSTETSGQSSRMKFMLEVMAAVKNNNMAKIPNYDPEPWERMKKALRVLIRKGNSSSEMNISLGDLLNAEKHGRWWIVGSAWSGIGPRALDDAGREPQQKTTTETYSQKLLELARKQRMNTDARRSVFCILMSAEDYMDAFEKLLRLGLKGAAERDIINVLVHCSLQEAKFNPYYHHLAAKFCTFDRKFQMMLQYAVWDRLKELKNLERLQVTNLAKLVGHVVLSKALPISVLKVIEFSELNKASLRLVRQVLLTILLAADQDAVAAVFTRVARPPGLKVFREGLRLFLHHFLLRNMKESAQVDVTVLRQRATLMDQALAGDHATVLL